MNADSLWQSRILKSFVIGITLYCFLAALGSVIFVSKWAFVFDKPPVLVLPRLTLSTYGWFPGGLFLVFAIVLVRLIMVRKPRAAFLSSIAALLLGVAVDWMTIRPLIKMIHNRKTELAAPSDGDESTN
ncbi:MAG: hypothetical protein ABIS50_00645 [Luteolibacter sp.]|uniref:hypothetical protein n=1 Tax=Luteolibacter sp. TaxID=1962973 RepID=UPI003264025F